MSSTSMQPRTLGASKVKAKRSTAPHSPSPSPSPAQQEKLGRGASCWERAGRGRGRGQGAREWASGDSQYQQPAEIAERLVCSVQWSSVGQGRAAAGTQAGRKEGRKELRLQRAWRQDRVGGPRHYYYPG